MRRLFCATAGLIAIVAIAAAVPAAAQEAPRTPSPMSSAGELARQRISDARKVTIESGGCVNEPECDEDEDEDAPVIAPALQAETSIAVDASGQHVVIGFNDGRGFTTNPVSVSGFMYSDDGGATFTDGGQLPTPGTDIIGGQRFPQVFGDPDVKYVAGCTFVYTSIGVVKFGAAGLAQGLVIHRSTDCGHTWTGPITIPSTINPNGAIDAAGDAVDAADKELTDIDPDTGRYMVCWTNFAAAALEMSCAYSDEIFAATPTFSARRLIAARTVDGQGSSVRFAGNGSPLAAVAWTTFSGLTNRTSLSRSTDNGVTWSAPVFLNTAFFTMDEVLGNDRVNTNPSLAFDTSNGPFSGSAYVVYSNNNARDGADVRFQRSTDGALTFSTPVILNSRPNNDRAQWFPYVTVDKNTGRVTVFYYDQGIDTSGDRTEITYTFSDDGGTSWSPPAPLVERPFRAGFGNDTSQPNLGDYNQAVGQAGLVYASFAITRQVGFADGQPSGSLTTPDVEARAFTPVARPPVRITTPQTTDSGADGALDPGEQVQVQLPLTNYVTNPLNAAATPGLAGTLSSATPGVTVIQPSSGYPSLAPGATAANSVPFVLQVAASFVPGTPIALSLTLTGGATPVVLPITLASGTQVYATLLTQNFDGVSPGTLPAGWVSSHGAGSTTVPWTTTASFNTALCGTSNRAFHQNANDAANPSRWERLFSPTLTVPSQSQFVSVDFDICYDTEDDPNFRIRAYDGLFLRITDLTPGRLARAVLAEAFAQEFTTDGFRHYPKHLPRNSDPSYFQNMSAWAGDSNGVQHVHLEFPGMADSLFQLRFEYTQDALDTCAAVRPGHACGVSIDNVVVRNVIAVAPPVIELGVSESLARDPTTGDILATITVTNNGTAPAPNVTLTSALLGAFVSSTPLPALGTIPAGGSASTVLRFPAAAGASGALRILRIGIGYDGGSGGGSFRVLLP